MLYKDSNHKYMVKTCKKYKYELFFVMDLYCTAHQLIDWCEDDNDYYFIMMNKDSQLNYIHILSLTVPLQKRFSKIEYYQLKWMWNHNVIKSPTFTSDTRKECGDGEFINNHNFKLLSQWDFKY
jgi:hypothetical protein